MKKNRNKISLCKENCCDNVEVFNGYCRLHYIKNWGKTNKDKNKNSKMKLIPGELSLKKTSGENKSGTDEFFKDYSLQSYPEDNLMPDCDFDIDNIIDNLKIED